MKRSLLILILFLSTQVYTQDFEGIIEYENTYEKSTEYDEINLEELSAFLGIKSTFITKQGKYKQISDGRFMSFQIYKPKESKLYYKDFIEGDTLFYKDLKKSESTKFEYRITKNSDTILGHVCHK